MRQVHLLLRLALAFPLLYAAIASLTTPKDWLWYIPDWVMNFLPPEPLLFGHGIFELLLGIWLLSGKKVFYVALLVALDLTAATLLNINAFTVVFRDVGLVLAAIALAILDKQTAASKKN